LIALSPDAYSVAVAVNDQIYFFNALTGELDEVIENVCNGKFKFNAKSKSISN
jgi:hypothetical protein